MGGHFRPVRHTRPALSMHIPVPVPAEVNKEDETGEVGYDSIHIGNIRQSLIFLGQTLLIQIVNFQLLNN